MLMTISQYARKHHKCFASVSRFVDDGRIPSVKMESDGVRDVRMIDSEFPYPQDKRLKNGRYVGWRKNFGKSDVSN